ncbi:MAG: tetratricopeptide repeat protein [Chloroflexota bacterium]
MNEIREQLERAYRYIKHDRTAEAEQILRSLLDEDSENVHAWWLLAHAQTDADEIRHALNRVLALDPDYPNAHKARELLDALESHFPTPADLDALAFFADDSAAAPEEGVLVEGTFTPPAPAHEPFHGESLPELDEVYLVEEEDAQVAELAASEDPFHDLEQDLLSAGGEGEEEAGVDSADLLLALGDDDVDLEALLQLEDSSEEEGSAPRAPRRRAGRRRRWGVLAFLAAILIAIVALWGFFLREEDGARQDPGPLTVLPVEDVAVASLLQMLNTQLETAGLGQDYRAVVANSDLGKTLYVEFCTEPRLALADAITQGMELVARQAPQAAGQVDAVGIWINRCQADPHDTLFRAEVALETAQRYVSGELGAGEIGLASFQALWTK